MTVALLPASNPEQALRKLSIVLIGRSAPQLVRQMNSSLTEPYGYDDSVFSVEEITSSRDAGDFAKEMYNFYKINKGL